MTRFLSVCLLLGLGLPASADQTVQRTFGFWTAECDTSPTMHVCGISTELFPERPAGRPKLTYSQLSGWMVVDTVTLSAATLRVDRGREYKTRDCLRRSGLSLCLFPLTLDAALFAELKAGRDLSITTRYPDRLQATVVSLDGFADALAYAQARD